MRLPWTHEELQAFLPKLRDTMRKEEEERSYIRPLPPMTVEEARDLFLRIFDAAEDRALSAEEAHVAGQLLAVYEMAVRAEMLGKKGRFFVLGEDSITEIMESLS